MDWKWFCFSLSLFSQAGYTFGKHYHDLSTMLANRDEHLKNWNFSIWKFHGKVASRDIYQVRSASYFTKFAKLWKFYFDFCQKKSFEFSVIESLYFWNVKRKKLELFKFIISCSQNLIAPQKFLQMCPKIQTLTYFIIMFRFSWIDVGKTFVQDLNDEYD